jgi:hypothetical protein
MFPSQAGESPDIWVDDALIVSNNNLFVEGKNAFLTAGTTLRGTQYAATGGVCPEIPLDITSICQIGMNSLNFEIRDYWGDLIGCSPLYVVLVD